MDVERYSTNIGSMMKPQSGGKTLHAICLDAKDYLIFAAFVIK